MTKQTTRGLCVLCGMTVLTATGPTRAGEDWPQWRGPNRDGHVAAAAAPENWPKQLTRKWKVLVGEGHASPVVADGRVFVHSRQQDDEAVRCVDLATGRVVWTQSYPAPYKLDQAARRHGKGPKSTPVVAGGRLFTLGISGILTCFEAESGRQLWQKQFSKEFPRISPLYGTAMSPLVIEDMLVAHVGGHNQGALKAFDAATGAEKWSWDGDGPGYASPILVDIGGSRQVVTQTQNALVGVSASNGRLLWRIPFKTAYDQNIVTPVVYKQTLIFSGYGQGAAGYRITRQGSKWVPDQTWHNKDISMYMSSPVVSGDLMFGMSHRRRGQLFCANAADGKVLWTSDGRMGDNVLFIAAGDAILGLFASGELLVFKNDPKAFDVLRRYKVAEGSTWAHPALVGRTLLVKDAKDLIRWDIP